ncbi:MAG: hypothetical protein AB8B96_16415 [Lysobacterales bacterium]
MALSTVDDEFLVVWARIGAANTDRTIRARRFDASNAQPVGDSFRVDTIDQVKANPTVAYNSDDNQYLVAWSNNTLPPRFQVLSAEGTAQLVQEVEFATAGFYTSRSQIVYNPDLGEYFIAFAQSDPAEGMVAESYEMFGRRISAGGSPLGASKFKISVSDFVDRFLRAGTNIDCGPGGQCLEAGRPGLAYVAAEQSYVVTWSGTVDVRRDGDREVLVRALKAGVNPAPGADQTQISNMGGDDINFNGLLPSIAASPQGILALWWGDDNANGGIDNKFELWGQNLTLSVFASSFEGEDP